MEYDYYSAIGAGTYAVTMLVSLAVSVIAIIAMWKIFVKAGEPGWACLIPLYNVYVLFKITWGNGWKCLLMLIPLANFVFSIMTVFKLGKAFGKGGGFCVGLLLLSPIFMCILGFGSDRYIGVDGVAAGGYGRAAYQQPSYQQQTTYQQTAYQQPRQAAYQPVAAQPAAARPVEAGAWTCPTCGAANEGVFCGNCGAKRPAPDAQPVAAPATKPGFCSNCGAKLEGGKFCPNCGMKTE